MLNDVSDFLSSIRDASTPDETWSAIVNFYNSIGFDVVNFGIVNSETDSILGMHSNMSADWMSEYMEDGYAEVDPLLQQVMKQTEPFIYTRETFHLLPGSENAKAKQMCEEVATRGIRSSLTCSLGETGSSIYSGANFGSSENSETFSKILTEAREPALIGLAIIHAFKDKLYSLSERSSSWYPVMVNADLTPREREVILCLSEGMRTNRIAERMSISTETVNFHVRSIKRKLGARTREQAIAFAHMTRAIF